MSKVYNGFLIGGQHLCSLVMRTGNYCFYIIGLQASWGLIDPTLPYGVSRDLENLGPFFFLVSVHDYKLCLWFENFLDHLKKIQVFWGLLLDWKLTFHTSLMTLVVRSKISNNQPMKSEWSDSEGLFGAGKESKAWKTSLWVAYAIHIVPRHAKYL